MKTIQISASPQPSGNATGVPQIDHAAGSQTAGGQNTEPFAKVLARRVKEADSQKTDAAADMPAPDSAAQVMESGIVPADALNAIMAQIPVERRGNDVAARAAMLAAGEAKTDSGEAVPVAAPMADAELPVDAAAAAVAAVAAGAVMPTQDAAVAPDEQAAGGAIAPGKAINLEESGKRGQSAAEMPDQRGVAQSGRQDGGMAAGKADALARASEQALAADALRQSPAGRSDASAVPASAAQVAAAAATISQSTVAALSGTPVSGQPVVTQTVSTPLSSPAWADDFTQKISWMVSQRNQVAELHLNPPNLGPLDVVLKISENQATALFTSPHAAVREAVENALPKLRELLADNGIMLSNATVGDQSSRERQAEQFANRGGDTATREAEGAVEASGEAVVKPARSHNGIVDTFA